MGSETIHSRKEPFRFASNFSAHTWKSLADVPPLGDASLPGHHRNEWCFHTSVSVLDDILSEVTVLRFMERTRFSGSSSPSSDHVAVQRGTTLADGSLPG